jgi:SAM-dependent methyltransferase
MISSPMQSGNSSDKREAVYRDLHSGQLESEEKQTTISAEKILGLLFGIYRPNSILDVGCGLGIWLSVAKKLGVADVYGIEGPWLNPKQLRIDPASVTIQDLEKPFHINRPFDLVICLEVAEHLPPKTAKTFIASLISHGDIVLFSAAIPYQSGRNHLNEQFPSYWADLFNQFDFIPIDFLRQQIWEDKDIFWWLRQNILLFVRRNTTAADETFSKYRDNDKPLSVVIPDIYISRMQMLEQTLRQCRHLLSMFSQEGVYTVESRKGKFIVSEFRKS